MNSFQISLPQFLPPFTYFLPFLDSGSVIIADHIQYTKRSLLTRCETLKNNLKLTVPVKNKGYTQRIYQKEITYTENWERKHLTSIYHHYHMLPYFDDYFHKIENIYDKHHACLNYFLLDLIIMFKSLLKIDSTILLASKEKFSDSLENNLIHFSKKNSNAVFLYKEIDVVSGFISLDKLAEARVETKALPAETKAVLKPINILDYLFLYGPEAAFKIREG